jgi:nitrate reductase gamma subunit
VALRMLREVVLFESLFRANLWIWAFGWVFHAALRWCSPATCATSPSRCGSGSAWVQPFGMYAGFAMAAGLAGLWARRFLVERIRYISTPSDHLMLALLVASRSPAWR